MRHLSTTVALLLSFAAQAQEPAPPAWGLERLMQQRSQVQAARAAFVEVRRIPDADTTLTSSGVLIYRAPDRLERETQSPSTERTVIENDRITLEMEMRRGQVSRRQFKLSEVPTLRPFFSALRAVLAGDADTLEHEFEVALEGAQDEWRLKLVPRGGAAQHVRDIAISGRGSEILAIELRQKNGDSSRTTLTPESVEFKTAPEPAPTESAPPEPAPPETLPPGGS